MLTVPSPVHGGLPESTGRWPGRLNGKTSPGPGACGPALAAPSSALAGGGASLAGSPDDASPVQGHFVCTWYPWMRGPRCGWPSWAPGELKDHCLGDPPGASGRRTRGAVLARTAWGVQLWLPALRGWPVGWVCTMGLWPTSALWGRIGDCPPCTGCEALSIESCAAVFCRLQDGRPFTGIGWCLSAAFVAHCWAKWSADLIQWGLLRVGMLVSQFS